MSSSAARRLTLIGALLAVTLGLAWWAVSPPAPAEAQTAGTLVSNTGQQVSTDWGISTGVDNAQHFTTGGSANGYRLTRIELVVHASNSDPDNYSVSIHSDIGGTISASLGTLTNPPSVPAAGTAIQFTAPGAGIDLDPNTGYWVVIDTTLAAGSLTFRAETTGREDSGGATGWIIANNRLNRNHSGGTWAPHGSAWAVAVYGVDKGGTYVLNDHYRNHPQSWCFNLAPVAECLTHIARWETEAEYVSTVNNVCPRTHSIRESYLDGVRCKQAFYPVLYTGRYPKAGFTPPAVPPPPDPCPSPNREEIRVLYMYGGVEYAEQRMQNVWWRDKGANSYTDGERDPFDDFQYGGSDPGSGWTSAGQEPIPADSYRTYTACLPPG